jgi:ATP-dependent Clp protease ATP-binding subunit ClpA
VFERFTEKAIKVIMLAQEEARRLGHNYVGSEQLLLGLIGEGTGIAAKTLKRAGINLKAARTEVENIIGRASGFVAVEIPFTNGCKRILEYSWDEARRLKNNYISTEHLLLGLLRDDEGIAMDVLTIFGVDPAKLEESITSALGTPPVTASSAPKTPKAQTERGLHIEDDLKQSLALIRLIEKKASMLNVPSLAAAMKRFDTELSRELFKLGINLETSSPPENSHETLSALSMAQEEALRLNHNSIGTELLLLGLIAEGTSAAAKELNSRGLTLEATQIEVEKIIGRGSGLVKKDLPYTPRAKHVFNLASEAAQQLGHKQIWPEHLLLGLTQEGEGVAARVFETMGIERKDINQSLLDAIRNS